MQTTNRVLLISYEFPPVGGAGVQRAAKFVKYLPMHGWQASVVTAKNPSVPVHDFTLSEELPDDLIVRRARSWEPAYRVKSLVADGESNTRRSSITRWMKRWAKRSALFFLQPDPQILWAPQAIRAASALLREIPHQAILATAPPFTSFLIGRHLSRRFQIPLVLDYRDEWDLSNRHRENREINALSNKLQQRMQAGVLRAARSVLTTTGASADAVRELCHQAGASPSVECIYNGYDPSDFRGAETRPAEPGAKYRLVYVGTLWNLTSVEPLVRAVEQLDRESPELTSRLELVFAGRRTEAQTRLLERLQGTSCAWTEQGYVDHAAAVRLMQSADGLCLLLSDNADAARVVPAKVFEYMAARRPILAIAPRGEVWHLLEDYPLNNRHCPADISGIAEALARAISTHPRQPPPAVLDHDLSRFARPSQAGELAAVLESAIRTDQPALVETV